MDIDWKDVSINGINWYMKIPNIFVEEVDIKDRRVTLGILRGVHLKLRVLSDEAQAELDIAISFSKELVIWKRSTRLLQQKLRYCKTAAE